MASENDITGDLIQTKTATEAYRSGWDRIFGKKAELALQEMVEENQKNGLYDSEPFDKKE